jgi:hypothetical protein
MNTKPSSSPDRNTFQKNSNKIRIIDQVDQVDQDLDKKLTDVDDVFLTIDESKRLREQDPEWQQNNLEWDLRTTHWILERVRASDRYAQNLYAALCNNSFCPTDSFEILSERSWSCSWRYAGGIIADMQEAGDYLDWYCSGTGGSMDYIDNETVEQMQTRTGYISEGVVTEEILQDLERLGWIVVTRLSE